MRVSVSPQQLSIIFKQGDDENMVENVTPGVNQGLEVVVDRHSDRQALIMFFIAIIMSLSLTILN